MINDIIKADFSPPILDDVAINILAIMEEYKISEIPVVARNNQFLGLLDESNILNMESLQEPLFFLKKKLKNIFLLSNSHIFQSIQILSENKLSLIPILDEKNSYLGYVQPKDIVGKMGLLGYNNNSIIIISLNKKDYTLHEISRLIEENNGKIISMWSESTDE